jgi:hypothetical protein
MSHERAPQEAPFWQLDEELGDVRLYGELYSVRGQMHLSEERYTPSASRHEIFPLQSSQGIRDYVLLHSYILLPDITLEVTLSPDTPRSNGESGTVTSSEWQGLKHERVGDGQAWYYRGDQTLLLWECLLFERHRTPDPNEDANLFALWHGFEDFLTQHFPTATRIVTPRHEPDYEPGQWEAFLQQLGYEPESETAFAKEVTP